MSIDINAIKINPLQSKLELPDSDIKENSAKELIQTSGEMKIKAESDKLPGWYKDNLIRNERSPFVQISGPQKV